MYSVYRKSDHSPADWLTTEQREHLEDMNRDGDFLAEGRHELVTAFEALKNKESYQGEFVTLTLAQTAKSTTDHRQPATEDL